MQKEIIKGFVDIDDPKLNLALEVLLEKGCSMELINEIKIEVASILNPERAEELTRLYGSRKEALDDSRLKIIKTIDVVELGYEGDRVKVFFPRIGDFEGGEFSYFTSYDTVSKEEFESDPKYEEASHSKEECVGFLEMMNRYLKALGMDMDKDVNFRTDLNDREDRYKEWCDTWGYITEVLGVYPEAGRISWYREYWLKDRDLAGKGSRVTWFHSQWKSSYFRGQSSNKSKAKLFLR